MPDNDDALELRRRARRRLIGAVALVLALVIIPPWVMDIEPKQVATNLTVEIPKQETGGLKPPAARASTPASGAPASAPAKAPESAAPPPAGDKPQTGIPRPPDVSPDTGKAGEKAKPEAARAAPKGQTKAETKAEARPEVKPETVARAAPPEATRKDGDAKRAEAILNAEGYLVPLGAFANKDNAKALEAKLAKAGVTYYSETVTTPAGEQTRVRAGPFPTKEAAEKSRERLKTLGLSPGAVIARP